MNWGSVTVLLGVSALAFKAPFVVLLLVIVGAVIYFLCQKE